MLIDIKVKSVYATEAADDEKKENNKQIKIEKKKNTLHDC